MPHRTPEQRLADAEEGLVIANRNASRQRRAITELEESGHETQVARVILGHLEETCQTLRATRERIRRELANGNFA